MRTFGNLPVHALTASVLAAFFASLSLDVSAGEPVRAEGTVEPEEVVNVGAQVNGMVTSLGPDPGSPGKTISYGSRVEEGTVLARLDDASYRAQIQKARAGCERAEAKLALARARMKKGSVSGSVVATAEGELVQSRIALRQAEINLGNTVIKSPIKGVVIDYRVNVGQTVAPTPDSPGLFLIGKDFRKMQVWASVNAADAGRIKIGTPVTFTVLAYPKLVFQGNVKEIRLNAKMSQNVVVVTYTVVVTTDNSDGKLIPYLIANVEFR